MDNHSRGWVAATLLAERSRLENALHDLSVKTVMASDLAPFTESREELVIRLERTELMLSDEFASGLLWASDPNIPPSRERNRAAQLILECARRKELEALWRLGGDISSVYDIVLIAVKNSEPVGIAGFPTHIDRDFYMRVVQRAALAQLWGELPEEDA